MKKQIAIYPGRFQPPGLHHKKTYDWLTNKFGNSNTYVVTSNKVELPKSPLNYNEIKTIWNMHGIKNIVQVKNPYIAKEIVTKFSPEDVIVFCIGQKDYDRLGGREGRRKKDGSLSYLLPYEKYKNDLKGQSEHAYYVMAPHIKINIGGEELSGTHIRKILSDEQLNDQTKKKLFKQMFGWYNEKIYNMLVNKFSKTDQYKHLQEGGAFGHLQNLYDDFELTFDDYKNIIKLGLSGQLQGVKEKLDGQNIMVSWKNGKLIIARNKGHLKNYGQNALDVNGLKDMFKGRGELETAFGQAGYDLQSALNKISNDKLKKIFKEGKEWMNLEIIYPSTQNVIPYGLNILIFHGTIIYDKEGNPVAAGGSAAADKLKKLIDSINANVQKTFSIEGPRNIQLNKVHNFSKKEKYFMNQINKLQSRFNLKDSDPILQYYISFFKTYIKRAGEKLNYKFSDKILNILIDRWAKWDKSINLNSIKKMIKDRPDVIKWIDDFDKKEHKKLFKQIMYPFDKLSLELGTEILYNAKNYIAAQKDDNLKIYKKEIENTIDQIKKSNNYNNIEKIMLQLKRIEDAGGLDKIVPSEGIVFVYKNKLYKFTGIFAPINQLLGISKFGR